MPSLRLENRKHTPLIKMSASSSAAYFFSQFFIKYSTLKKNHIIIRQKTLFSNTYMRAKHKKEPKTKGAGIMPAPFMLFKNAGSEKSADLHKYGGENERHNGHQLYEDVDGRAGSVLERVADGIADNSRLMCI